MKANCNYFKFFHDSIYHVITKETEYRFFSIIFTILQKYKKTFHDIISIDIYNALHNTLFLPVITVNFKILHSI